MSEQEFKKMIKAIVVPESLPDEEKYKRYQTLQDFLKNNTPSKLFRFRGCKERSFSEFDQDILGFASAFEMNDDFDGMLFFDKKRIEASFSDTVIQQTFNRIVESAKIGAIPEDIKNSIPKVVLQQFITSLSSLTSETINYLINKFIDFAYDNYDNRMAFIGQLTQNQKIACLSQRIESAAMWGYYANDGTGFALSYDLREPDFSEYCLAPVIYGEERLDATDYANWLFQQQILQRLLLQNNAFTFYSYFKKGIPCPDEFMSMKVLLNKAIVWEHEQEWRLIYYERNGQNVKYPHISKRPSAVYLGRNISAINEKILRQIADEKDIPVYKMKIREEIQTYDLYPQII